MAKSKVAYFARNTGRVSGPGLSVSGVMDETGGNTGNLLFFRAARELFEEEVVLAGRTTAVESFADSVDKIVISAANFLNPDWDFRGLGNMIEKLGKECLVFGLGAQSQQEGEIPRLQDGTIHFLRAAAAHSRTIFVRGAYSARVCEHYGVRNVQAAGCPSVTLNGNPQLGAQIQARIGQPLARLYCAGATFKKDTQPLERNLFALINALPGSLYCVQNPEPVLALADGIYHASGGLSEFAGRAHQFLDPESDLAGFLARFARVAGYFTDVAAWLQDAASYDYSVCTRIHGAMATLMAGVPAVVAGHDARVRELCEAMAIPCRAPAEIAAHTADIPGYFQSLKFDGQAFDRRRQAIAATYAGYLRDSGLTPSARLLGLAT